MSLRQHYSPLHENNDIIDDNDITSVDVKKEMLPLTKSLE